MNITDKAIIALQETTERMISLRTQLATAQAERDALRAALERVRDLQVSALSVKPATSYELELQGAVQAQKWFASEALTQLDGPQ